MLSISELAELSRLTCQTHATAQRLARQLRQQSQLAKLLGKASHLARKIEQGESREAEIAIRRYRDAQAS